MEPNLFKYIWRHSKRDQAAILLLVLVSLPFYFASLNLPKQIVNVGIQGKGFAGPADTQVMGKLFLPLGDVLFGHPVLLFGGLRFDQVETLLILSFAFLGLVCVNGAFKFVINTAKGRLGERMLRRLRFELSDRLLRFRLGQLRRMKGPEVATMIKDEVEPLGGFIGDAFVTPAFLGGQAITAMVFIMSQSLWLGLIAGGIVLLQALLIPRLRIPILRLGKQRQLTARQLAGRVGEVMDGAVEIHANDGSNWERAELTSRLGQIFHIRFEIYQRKFFVKFLNNFLSQLTPFIFYAGGGLLAIYGQLDIGSLVAVIAAYKDLPGPIRDLINWEQQRQDVQIKYDQVIEQFQPTDILEPAKQDPDAEVRPLDGMLSASSLTLIDDNNQRQVDGVSFELPLDRHIALVGDAISGKDHLAMLLAGLAPPSGGKVRIGEQDLQDLPEAVLGRRIGYVDPAAYLFSTSLRDNLLYGLRHRPLREAEQDGKAIEAWKAALAESLRAGNSPFHLEADWTDYEAAGCTGPDDLLARVLEVLDVVDLGEDVYRFGLNGSIDPAAQPDVAGRLLEARNALTRRLAEQSREDLVVRFDAEQYNANASLAENLLFGTPKRADYEAEALIDNALVGGALQQAGLQELLGEKGLAIARTMVEIFADLPPGHPFFEQFSFIDADDLPEFRQLVTRAEQRGVEQLPAEDRRRIKALPFRYIEARHRLGLVDDVFETRVLEARRLIAEAVRRRDPTAVEFYDAEAYNSAASILDNVLFGRLVYGQAGAEEAVGAAVRETLDELDLKPSVCAIGLDFEVGVGGKRLSATQRQKTALARALLKRPDLLVVNQATAVMDGATRARLVENVLRAREGRGVAWAIERAALAERFEQVLVLRNGRLIDNGAFDDLSGRSEDLKMLLAAD
ncbi:ABC-type multidrug transport system, ATPase and permease component [Tistlia consotensis]|uniref:ABC-type multidrug transport system, ATPase and permease component n=1 Tax=Tistlia consotensis USBA 355 TaxID=560819 RepID=A0A1Y6BGZ4_9PROT|nr:ABC transporter ATP-binding protein/permease [Tistlia consotensis]SMF09400.1 ABC-type multidrug transport system, ATPase and permease component [Tistlia consotensis USBA 355]SNR34578.1 ABC-type multidrug transport system, ATPase and permease component [Tistlia consotensis]